MNRLSAEERFCRDPLFAQLVMWCEKLINEGNATPTELREAVTLAAVRVEMRVEHPPMMKRGGCGAGQILNPIGREESEKIAEQRIQQLIDKG